MNSVGSLGACALEVAVALAEELADAGGYCPWFAFEAGARDPHDLDPGELQILLPLPIALEGGRAAVVLVRVEFDGKPLRWPVGVKLVSSGDEVHRRLRQSRAPGHREEESLEIGAREAGNAVDGHGIAKPGDSTESLAASKQIVDCTVDPYPYPGLPPGRRGDIDRARESGRQAPKPGSGAMTEQGSRLRAAAQDRGHAFAVLRNAPVPNRIDPSVQRVDPPGSPSMPNRTLGITKPLHLPNRHHSVLPLSKRRQPMVRSSFCVHMDY